MFREELRKRETERTFMSNDEGLSHRKNDVRRERKDDGLRCVGFCKFLFLPHEKHYKIVFIFTSYLVALSLETILKQMFFIVELRMKLLQKPQNMQVLVVADYQVFPRKVSESNCFSY